MIRTKLITQKGIKHIIIMAILLVIRLNAFAQDKLTVGFKNTIESADGTNAKQESEIRSSGGFVFLYHLNRKLYFESGLYLITRGYSENIGPAPFLGYFTDPLYQIGDRETYIFYHLSIPLLLRVGHKFYFTFGPSIDHRLRVDWISPYTPGEPRKLDIENLTRVVLTGHLALGQNFIISKKRNIKGFLEARVNSTLTKHTNSTLNMFTKNEDNRLLNYGLAYGITIEIKSKRHNL